jgi:hypothetical protein
MRVKSRGYDRRCGAVQTNVRGGCSGGRDPSPSGEESFFGAAIFSEAVKSGWNTTIDMPVRLLPVEHAMKTQLSQPTGAAAFDGQHGMSFAISSITAEADISFAMACMCMSAAVRAIPGWETGVRANPAINKIANSRRMRRDGFTGASSHNRHWTAGVPTSRIREAQVRASYPKN